SVRLAPDGTIFLAGTTNSSDFPTTPAAFRPRASSGQEAFLIRVGAVSIFNPQPVGTLLYSSYVGPASDAAVAAVSQSKVSFASRPGVGIGVTKADVTGSKAL